MTTPTTRTGRLLEAAQRAAERQQLELEAAETARRSGRRAEALELLKAVCGIESLTELGLTSRKTAPGSYVWADGDVGVAARDRADGGFEVFAVLLVDGGWTWLGEPIANLADVAHRVAGTAE